MEISIINGPNLNLLGKREPGIYGDQSFEGYLKKLKSQFSDHELIYRQSNIEGELVDFIQEMGFRSTGIILNAGAYTHTSIAISDAIAAVPCQVIEVHISNIYARESFRHKSIISQNCVGLISGLGLDGYRLALNYLLKDD